MGYYYLHTDGNLIWTKFEPDRSDFVKAIWPCDTSNRAHAWIIAIEGLALGANKARIMELKVKWGLTDEDAHEFVKYLEGRIRLFRDGDAWCVTATDFINLQETPAGFGDTALEALAHFAKQGFQKNGVSFINRA